MKLVATVFLLLMTAGCIAYKHPAQVDPPSFASDQGRVHCALRICVRRPAAEDFKGISDEYEGRWRLDAATARAQRLVEILLKCQLFDSVRLADAAPGANELVAEALPVPNAVRLSITRAVLCL